MEKDDIVWFVEHISRELDVACSVAALLEKKYNKKIKILPYSSNNSKQIICQFNPQIVLLPYCYSIQDKALRNYLLNWEEAVYINLAWEQIFYKANLEYKAPRDTFAKKFVIHHTWSMARCKFLQERGVPKRHIFVNGHPAYKLYELPYRDAFVPRIVLAKEFNLDFQKKWIFFPENFSWYFYSDYNLEEIIKNGQDRKTAYLMRDYCGKSLLEVVKWFQEVLDNSKQIEMILRPRPAVSIVYFKHVLNRSSPTLTKNIHILKDYSVREWILASDTVISSFSTSLIEGAIAQKPVYMLEPFKIPEALTASWYAYVKKLRTKNDFFEMCFGDSKKGINIQLYDWAKRQFLANSDPIMGLVDFLGQFQKSDYNLKRQYLKQAFKSSGFYKNRLERIKDSLINTLGSLKRDILENRNYYINDDEEKYNTEISEKTRVYQEFFQKWR